MQSPTEAAPLRVEALQEELSTAINREWERKAVDDMKKRAIVSATSYDEFKNMVACATQKPLSREDFAKKPDLLNNKAVKPSSSGAGGVAGSSKLGGLEALLGGRGVFTLDESAEAAASSAGALRKLSRAAQAGGSSSGGVSVSASAASSSTATAVSSSVRTPGDFDREWRRARRVGMARADATPEEEMFYTFLRSIGDVSRVAGVFKGELDGDVLGRLTRAAAWTAEQSGSEKVTETSVVSGAGGSSGSMPSSGLGAGGDESSNSSDGGSSAPASTSSSSRSLTPVQYMLQLLLEVSRTAAGFGLAWDLLAPPEQAAFRKAVLPAATPAAFGGSEAAVVEFNDAFA